MLRTTQRSPPWARWEIIPGARASRVRLKSEEEAMVRAHAEFRSNGVSGRGSFTEESDQQVSEDLEAYRELCSLAGRKTGSIPATVIARHVLAVTPDVDWPVRRAALEALLRRLEFARRDRLKVSAQPTGWRQLGIYETRRQGDTARPYTTVLTGVDPPGGSCDCPDYLRSSLVLCKHLLTVLEASWSGERKLRAARREQERLGAPPGLWWDPVRPATGPGDYLERVHLRRDVSKEDRRESAVVQKWFRDGEGGRFDLRSAHADDVSLRQELVADLLELHRAHRRRGNRLTDPALAALLAEERDRLGRRQGGGGGRIGATIDGLRIRLYPYQVEGVQRFLETGRLLLGDDMGLGKTAQAIAACQVLSNLGKVRRGLIIVPASLKSQWRGEWTRFTDLPVALVSGPPAERRSLYAKRRRGFLIANYEQVIRDLEAMHRWKPDMVILDEAQRIKNWETKTSAFVKRLRPQYRLVLTGTPMENRLDELASIMDWVDSHALEPKWRLAPWHTTYADGRTQVVGARNLDTLRDRLSGSLVRRVRQEVLDQLPKRVDSSVPVRMTSEQISRHDVYRQEIAKLMAIARRRPLSQREFLKLMTFLTLQRILANGVEQADFEDCWPELSAVRHPSAEFLGKLDSPKLLEFREILSQLTIRERRKVVVFSQWRRMLRLASWAVEGPLAEHGLRAVFFTGAEGQKRRMQNIVDFHDDPGACVFFATDAGGVGLNLQRAANCCINLDLPWNPAVLEQRIGRIYRLGQRRPIDTYNLIAEGSIEERIAGLIGNKRALFSGLFEGKTDTVEYAQCGSFLGQLDKIVEPVEVPDLDESSEETPDDDAFGPPPGDATADEPPVSATREPGSLAVAPRPPGPGTLTGVSAAAALPDAAQLERLFSEIDIRGEKDGSLTIRAPAEAASTLAALLDGMAGLLRGGGK